MLPRTAWLEIDIDALGANLAAIRDLAGPGVRVEPVVKADAYGHGVVPVARALEAAGADGFSVATFDEAVGLREAGIRVPILVLFPVLAEHAAEASRREISLAVGDEVLLDRLLEVVRGATTQSGSPLRVHLEVETGLGRGGLAADRVEHAAAAIERTDGIRLDGVWSHLQEPEDEPRTQAQGERFDAALAILREAGVEATRHLSASGGLLAGAGGYDAIRPGLTIYGLQPDEILGTEAATRLVLRPAMALRARPVRVVDLPEGWGISYGPTFVTARPSRIATLPLGYGDGWPRALSNRAGALVRGTRVPIVGNVAMDAVMADVTDVPGPPVGVDDEFTLIGDQGQERITVHDLARSRNTNSWEVVTSMARRMPRVYHAAAGLLGIRTLADAEGAWLGSNSGTGTSASSRSTRS